MKKILFDFLKKLVGISILIGMRPKHFLWFMRIFIFIMFLPFIFSIKGCETLAFDANTGVIGDTIGGITAPFINFLGAILVYLALKAQIEANNKIQTHFEVERKEKYENLIYNEVINRLNGVFQKLEKLDGSSFEKCPPKEYILSNLMDSVIFESEKDIFNNNLELSSFKGEFSEMVELLELFNSNVSQEKAFLKLVELRIEQFYKLNFYSKLSLLRNDFDNYQDKRHFKLDIKDISKIELVLRLLKVELAISKKLDNKRYVLRIEPQIELYNSYLQDITMNIDFYKKIKELKSKIWTTYRAKSRDVEYISKNPNKYEGKLEILYSEEKIITKEYEDFLKLFKSEENQKYYDIDKLISEIPNIEIW